MVSHVEPLGQVASVRTVMTFRDKSPDYEQDGNACVLTIKDLVGKRSIDYSVLPTVNVEDSQLENRLRNGDVLIPGRGEYYPARHFPGHGLAVYPVGQINVLTPHHGLNSEYFTWFLNQDEAQFMIRSYLSGSGIQSLSKSKLLTLPVKIPSHSIQEEIAALQTLQAERSTIMEELLIVNQKAMDAVCLGLLSEGMYIHGR